MPENTRRLKFALGVAGLPLGALVGVVSVILCSDLPTVGPVGWNFHTASLIAVRRDRVN